MLDCDTFINFVSSKNKLYNILIVEDTKFINDTIRKTLLRFGYECDQSFSLLEAREKLSTKNYDYVLLDLNLPDGFGDELVDEIKVLSKAKIIILTAETDPEHREALFKDGILDYIVKDKYFNDAVSEINTTINNLEKNKESNILVIDDSRFLQKHISQLLHTRNYNILSAYNANNGYEMLLSNRINLIVLDMELPDMHGLTLLRKIQKNKELASIPVMVLSASNNKIFIRDSLKAGAFEFIQKPFNIEELVLKIEIAIDSDRKTNEIKCKQQVLSDYKDAVDRSSIVSKTDPKGIITFVNDKFCEISGFTREELIGKKHNIVKHPDMQDDLFKDMWNTIKNKKAWTGEIKNKAKDGSSYWVQTVINPILDQDKNIIEYIGIRSDITKIETIKEELQNNLNISNKNFSQVYKISQEYQKAIDESNILSRADTSGKITYVNKQFCEISGYTEDELIGQSHRIVKHPDNDKRLYEDLWKTITSKKIWRKQIKNMAKDGTSYYVDSTIVPILDEENNIVEYLGIRHDVTQIVKFHQSLEDTQKEIIHKMGEVGEMRSLETGFHVKRVAMYSKILALLVGLSKDDAELLYSASPMHDIGKVGIPDSVLKKPGKLDTLEWEIMQTHSKIGYDILADSDKPILKAASIVAYEHHEKWDGSGYPNAKKGDEIHIYARITAIADVFDALGSDRCYKKAWILEDILTLFKKEQAKQFDPKLVDLFLDNLDKFLEIRDKFKDQV